MKRKQPEEQKPLVLEGLNLGYNGYADPTLLNPRQWAAASNVYSGQHGSIRRLRTAPVVTTATTGYSAQSAQFKSLYNFRDPSPQSVLLGDVNNKQFSFNVNSSYTATQRLNPYVDPTGTGVSSMGGVWSRATFLNIAFEMNGSVKQTGRGTNAATVEGWGLDTPDASPAITLSAGVSATIAASPTGASRTAGITTITTTAAHGFAVGNTVNISGVTDTSFSLGSPFTILTVPTSTTFTYSQAGVDATSGSGTASVSITKTIGRSYAFAFENANKFHVSANSPVTRYVTYSSQKGTIDCIQPGTINTVTSSTTVTGTGTAFTSAWIGRRLWIEGVGATPSTRVVAVASATALTVSAAISVTNGSHYQITDPQMTHLRLYATADGGALYLRTQRNAFTASATTLSSAGLEFVDSDNAEPPNGNFTSEQAQLYNVPPPVGSFLHEYQSRILVYGVSAVPQTFFYSNIELTLIGNAPESYAPLNQVTLPLGDAKLNGMAVLPTGLIIWSDKHDMFKLTGQLTDNSTNSAVQLGATIQRLPYSLGCASPYTPTVTRLGTLWLTSDREVYLFTDHYAPKNVGRPVQDILLGMTTSQLSDARGTYYHSDDRNWYVLSVATGNSTFNNKLLILDLDLLASNGSPSFFTFDMATNQPAWYIFDVNSEAIANVFDSSNLLHLVSSDTDLITDVGYRTGNFVRGVENVLAGSFTLHALGNQDSWSIKKLEWFRAITKQDPSTLAGDGWSFAVDAIDDDKFTFASPDTQTFTPGATSLGNAAAQPPGSPAGTWPGLVTQRGLEFSPALFKAVGVKSVQGRRLRFRVTFPNLAGTEYEFRGFQLDVQGLKGR